MIPGILPALCGKKISNYSRENIIFTDGSLIDSQTGFGFYSLRNESCYKLEQPCSIYVAEMTAIYFACLRVEKYPPAKYLICSDSLSSLTALHNIKVDGRTNHL